MKAKIFLALAVVAALGTWWVAQSSRGPSKPDQAWPKNRPVPIPDAALDPKTLREAGLAYDQAIKPLLQRACFDCHSAQTDFPWYHHLPLVAGYLDEHVRKAREHLDLTDGFPFQSKRPIASRIRSIGGSVKRGSMPLWDYKLMHPSTRLSVEEKTAIIDWSESTFKKLSETARPL